jgi:hypothetical protein
VQALGGVVLGGQSFLFKIKAIAYRNFQFLVFFSDAQKTSAPD